MTAEDLSAREAREGRGPTHAGSPPPEGSCRAWELMSTEAAIAAIAELTRIDDVWAAIEWEESHGNRPAVTQAAFVRLDELGEPF